MAKSQQKNPETLCHRVLAKKNYDALQMFDAPMTCPSRKMRIRKTGIAPILNTLFLEEFQTASYVRF
ncbi:MAG: hypothetical protein KGL96_02585, partial [Hyphomicrobiales bacterium]|nr:hypothetical protein [Hyphomicrobiales bacterium]